MVSSLLNLLPMTIDELKAKLSNYGELVNNIKAEAKKVDTKKYLEQLDPTKHDITNEAIRPDKVIVKDDGSGGIVKVTRIALPLQKQIVNRAATFLCGNPIEIQSTTKTPAEEAFLNAIYKVWDDNKLDFKSKALAKLMMGETQAAELWYTDPLSEDETLYWDGILSKSAKFKLRIKILANSLGDNLYPVNSPTGDMIAFGRGYEVTLGDGKKEEHFDLYTAENIILGVKGETGWTNTSNPNLIKKIPIIYYAQPAPEWADVQLMIDHLEKILSNHGDTNEYNGSPILALSGKLMNMIEKGGSGKMLQLEPGASANYVTWDQAPASIKMEIENLLHFIHSCTDTPSMSFKEMQDIGEFSEFALKMLFMGAHMKASDKEEIFGESIQRRLNFIKAAIQVIDTSTSKISISLKPKFEYFLPKNQAGKIDLLNSAVSGKILSKESAVKLNPLVEDADIEIEKLKEEASGTLDETFD